jgi:hypothetical protein
VSVGEDLDLLCIGLALTVLIRGRTVRWSRPTRSSNHHGANPETCSAGMPRLSANCHATATNSARAAKLGAIGPLADVLERSRRLIVAEDRVARELAGVGGWVVERYVLLGNQRVPFVLLGPSGVFALCATDGAWSLYDLEVLSCLGDELRDGLPGYRGRVEAVVCLAFDHAEPRAWYGGADRGGRGGWVLGVDQLLRWLCGWEPEHGLAADDVSRIAVEAGPHWRRRSTTRLPISGNAG